MNHSFDSMALNIIQLHVYVHIRTHHCKLQVGLDLACWLPALGVLVTASDREQGQLPPADLPGALLLSSCLGWVLGGLSSCLGWVLGGLSSCLGWVLEGLSSCLGWVLGGLSRGACGMGSGQVGTPQALTCSPPFF